MDLLQVEPPSSQRSRAALISRNVGSGAGFLAISLMCYALGAVVWGWWRHPYSAFVVSEDGQAVLHGADNLEANAYIWFALATALIALGTTVWGLRGLKLRGLKAMLWALVVAFLGAVAFSLIGDSVAALHYPPPTVEHLAVGDVVKVTPVIHPGIAFLAAPFVAAMVYWFSFVLEPDVDNTAETESYLSAEPHSRELATNWESKGTSENA